MHVPPNRNGRDWCCGGRSLRGALIISAHTIDRRLSERTETYCSDLVGVSSPALPEKRPLAVSFVRDIVFLARIWVMQRGRDGMGPFSIIEVAYEYSRNDYLAL